MYPVSFPVSTNVANINSTIISNPANIINPYESMRNPIPKGANMNYPYPPPYDYTLNNINKIL